jgi:hypothetical protein
MQFRLSTLAAAITLCAVFCAIFFAVPLFVEIPLLTLMVLVAPSIWICGACFAKGRWRAFFLGGLCAGWLPSAILMYFGGMSGASLVGDGDIFAELDSGEGYEVIVRLSIAGAFLFPGFVAILGGSCGALVYHWFGADPIAKPTATSRLHEPYVLLESRVTPLASSREEVPGPRP